MNIFDAWPLLTQAIPDFLNLEWSEISFKRSSTVLKATAFIAVAFFASIWWRRRRNSQPSFYSTSGLAFAGHHRPGAFFRLVRGTTWLFMFAALCLLAVTLADPVVFITGVTEQSESRELVYVRDVSASNGFRLQGSTSTRAAITQEFIEKLALKRRNKNDRAAFIVFGTQSEVWSSFTTSFESFMFSVSMAPRTIAPTDALNMWKGDFILKKGEWVEQDNGGSTNLHLGLQSAIFLFDRHGSPEITAQMKNNPSWKMRSVIIITDGAADADPEPQFRELRKRNIIPYLIFIDPAREVEKKLYGETTIKAQLPDQLLTMVRRYGGQYFLARDRKSVDQISEKLDQLQSIRQTRKVSVKEREIYFIPLALALLAALAALTLRAVSALLWRTV